MNAPWPQPDGTWSVPTSDAEALHVAQSEITMLRDERDLLRVQLQAFQGMPYVPKADHERVLEQRDSALALADALTRELANASDKRLNVALTEAVGYLTAELADHAKDFVHPATAIRRNLMRAFVVEHGGKAGEE